MMAQTAQCLGLKTLHIFFGFVAFQALFFALTVFWHARSGIHSEVHTGYSGVYTGLQAPVRRPRGTTQRLADAHRENQRLAAEGKGFRRFRLPGAEAETRVGAAEEAAPPRGRPPADLGLFCEESAVPAYAVCNGLSNQLLGHAGFIADLIQQGKRVAVPDAFIVHGVQEERDRRGDLVNVVANLGNSLSLTDIIDGEHLLREIRRHGVEACFVPHPRVVHLLGQSRRSATCSSWLETLRDAPDDVEFAVLSAFRPSALLGGVVDATMDRLEEKTHARSFSLEEGVCLHHRDGPDWHDHCKTWRGNNCRNADNRKIEDLVRDRIPAAYPKRWMYYVGDAAPDATLVAAMRRIAGVELFHRERDGLLGDDGPLRELLGFAPTLARSRDVFAAVDFFVCRRIPSFVGNSVSTFSALQIAQRRGKRATWYNSRSNPLLADFLRVQEVPVVYTYTEESQLLGKILLKASITSVRQTLPEVDVHILYHGTKDRAFLKWLSRRNVIVHPHRPRWLSMIDNFIANADQKRSHLYSHRGNYIGTWQRIDIPLFLDAEYVLFLDSDTIVHAKFDLSTFGLDITPGIAFSNEIMEEDRDPSNAGVALFNVPLLRETHKDFILFVQDHARLNQDFVLGPSDQGAYLDYYHAHKNPGKQLTHKASTYVQYLDVTFNVKPYYKKEENFQRRKVVHFHGLKPHDIMKGLMGYRKDDYPTALHLLLPMLFGNDDNNHLLCLTLHDFARSIAEDFENLDLFCEFSFPHARKEKIVCNDFLWRLSKMQKNYDCVRILGAHGFRKDKSLLVESLQNYGGWTKKVARIAKDKLMRRVGRVNGRAMRQCAEAERGYFRDYPDIEIAVARNQFPSGFVHWKRHGRHEGRQYQFCPAR